MLPSALKKVEAADVFDTLLRFKSETAKHLCKIAKENYCFSPLGRDPFAKRSAEEASSRAMRTRIENWAKTSIFTYKWFYDTEFQLLGVFSVPTCMRKFFDATIIFQDSCDQDYEEKAWRGIPEFEHIYYEWQDVSDAEIIDLYRKKGFGELSSAQCDYYRRDFCYDEIWSRYEKYLENSEEFGMYFSCFGPYDLQSLLQFWREILTLWKEDQKLDGAI